MLISGFVARAARLLAAMLVSGCSGLSAAGPASPQLPTLQLPSPEQNRAVDASRDGSWMLPEARSQDLLYVTNYSYVTIYSYPQDVLVGTLNGFRSAVGECVDKNGDVFVANELVSRIYEYRHAGARRIADLRANVGAQGCAVDPVTGNLAVAGSSGVAGVDIFKDARGKPSFIKAPQFFFTTFCAYDDKGDLFVEGYADVKGHAAFAELPNGSRKFMSVKLDKVISSEGGVAWDGKHVAVGAYIPPRGSHSTPVIYQFDVSNGRGIAVGTVKLGKPAYITTFEFFIAGRTVIVPNWYYENSMKKYNVLFFRYPVGGKPTMQVTKHISSPRGVVVSRAS